ncbi:MAG: hypothetical protein RIQ81_341 [Pseudomonadota bacterium]|jgi:hypothetical protein
MFSDPQHFFWFLKRHRAIVIPLVALLLYRCGTQRVTFRGVTNVAPGLGVPVTAGSDAKINGCNFALEKTTIVAGTAPRARVSLLSGKAIQSLSINGDTLTPSDSFQDLAKVDAIGTVKMMALAYDEFKEAHSCVANLLVERPFTTTVELLPSCSISFPSMGIVRGEAAEMTINLLNVDAAKFKVTSAQLIPAGSGLPTEDLPLVFPVSKTFNGLVAGQYIWNARVELRSTDLQSSVIRTIGCGGGLVVSEGMPSCLASITSQTQPPALNSQATITVTGTGNHGAFVFPQDSQDPTSKKTADSEGKATFAVTLSQYGTNLFPVRVVNKNGTLSSLCIASIAVPSPAAGPDCSVSPASTTAALNSATEFFLSNSGSTENYSNITTQLSAIVTTPDDVTSAECPAGSAAKCASFSFRTAGFKIIRGVISATDPMGNPYRRECTSTVTVSEPAAACEVAFGAPASPAGGINAAVAYAGFDVTVPLTIRRVVGSGLISSPVTVTAPDGQVINFESLNASSQFVVNGLTGKGPKPFVCTAIGPGGSRTNTSLLTVNDTSAGSLSCSLMRTSNDNTPVISGTPVSLTMVITKGNQPLASARLASQPDVGVASFAALDASGTKYSITGQYTFSVNNEVVQGSVTDSAGNTATCMPAFSVNNVIQLPACALGGIPPLVTAKLNLPASIDAANRTFSFKATPEITLTGGSPVSGFTEAPWKLLMASAAQPAVLAENALAKSGLDVVNAALPDAAFLSGQDSQAKIVSSVIVAGQQVACSSPLFLVRKDSSVPLTVNSGFSSVQVSAAGQSWTCNAQSTCNLLIPAGASVSMVSTPSNGYQFASWSGPCAGSNNPSCSFAITNTTNATVNTNDTTSGNLSCTVMRSNNDNAQIISGTPVNLTMVINKGNQALASARIGSQAPVLASGFTALDGTGTRFSMTSPYTFTANNEVAQGSVTDAAGNTVACAPPFMVTNLVQMPTCTMSGIPAPVISKINLPAPALLANQTFAFKVTPSIILSGGNVGTAFNEISWTLHMSPESLPLAHTYVPYALTRSGSDIVNPSLPNSAFVPVGDSAAKIIANLTVGGFPLICVSPHFVVRQDKSVPLTINSGNSSVQVVGANQTVTCQAGSTCTYSNFPAGSSIAMTASPSTGYRVSSWSGSCSAGAVNSCSFTIVNAATVTVNTSPTLTVVSGNSTVALTAAGMTMSCGANTTCSFSIPAGTAVSMQAAPLSGYQFSSWSGACSGSTSPACAFNLSNPTTVTVNTAAIPPPPPPNPCDYDRSLRGLQNVAHTIQCQPNTAQCARIWGDFDYTGDSHPCVAAIHCGAISNAVGGTIRATWGAGLSSYVGATRNGVVSSRYDNYGDTVRIANCNTTTSSQTSSQPPPAPVPATTCSSGVIVNGVCQTKIPVHRCRSQTNTAFYTNHIYPTDVNECWNAGYLVEAQPYFNAPGGGDKQIIRWYRDTPGGKLHYYLQPGENPGAGYVIEGGIWSVMNSPAAGLIPIYRCVVSCSVLNNDFRCDGNMQWLSKDPFCEGNGTNSASPVQAPVLGYVIP